MMDGKSIVQNIAKYVCSGRLKNIGLENNRIFDQRTAEYLAEDGKIFDRG
jgi:hypothetical protein